MGAGLILKVAVTIPVLYTMSQDTLSVNKNNGLINVTDLLRNDRPIDKLQLQNTRPKCKDEKVNIDLDYDVGLAHRHFVELDNMKL